MRRLFIITLLLCALANAAMAQRITHNFQNVSISDALKYVQQQTSKHKIDFIYNELEDFKVTTSIRNKSVPEAIRQLIGFYPIRVTQSGDNEIYVECTHKSDRHLTGKIVDEKGVPLEFADVRLLNPSDSSYITGGVTNASGVFVIPLDQPRVIAKFSYIGYKPVYKLCSHENVGTIQMQIEATMLGEVTVKGERIFLKTENGHLIYNMPMLLQVMPADNAYDAITRIPGVAEFNGNITFSGQSLTLIINGKATTLTAEQVAERLKQMPAEILAKAEVMPSAPPKYHIRGMAINIITKDFAGTNQFSGQLNAGIKQHKYTSGSAGGSFIYNHDKLSMDASYSLTGGTGYGQAEHKANHPLGDKRMLYSDKITQRSDGINHQYHIGVEYAFADNHRLGTTYTGEWNGTKSTNTTTGTANSTQHSTEHDYLHNVDVSYSLPFGLQLGASYTNYQNPRTQNLEGEMYDTNRNLYVDSRQKVGKWLFTADQTHVLKNGWELNYGGKAQFTNNNSYQTTLDENHQPIADATSHVDYNERILNAYAGFSKQIGESLSLDASLTAEQYHATKWNEWRVYPQFNAMWNINSKNLLNLSFSSEAIYPSYWSTMSSIYYSSVYTEIWGNPDLKPMSKYDINLIWQLNHKYTFTAFATFEPDYFVQLPYQPNDRMAVIMKETNFDYSNYYGLHASAQFSVGKWLNGQVNATGLYRHDKSHNFFDLPFNRNYLSAIIGGTVVVKLSTRHNIQFVFNPFFQSRAIQGVYDIDPLLSLNASLRWTSNNGKWSVIAKGNNILNNHITTRSKQGNQDYDLKLWMNYASASLTVIYRIGSYKEKKRKEVDTSRMGY
ncbi:MAG: TonB-dependent receptor family protein [Muribaculaceae bacterium]|nr:TonB-dependent receptor family protein [Muribaculaceae bacterium]